MLAKERGVQASLHVVPTHTLNVNARPSTGVSFLTTVVGDIQYTLNSNAPSTLNACVFRDLAVHTYAYS